MPMLTAVELALRRSSPLPSEYHDLILMRWFGCTHQELMETPADVVDYAIVWMVAEGNLAREDAAKRRREAQQ